ncbi:MAG: type II toxin-antitoxin system VapC family toxin [Alphaproteobacteria bacterium]
MAERQGVRARDIPPPFAGIVATADRFRDHPDERAAMELARRHRPTVYDAAYLDPAVREKVPLATLNTALAIAARVESVPLVGE